ncbi:hypothetical protein GJ672_03725 [Spiribacter sp. 2438]|uniref:hypothetical protein n=1 Tax=Spiribacter sp. 2438 TaxID=2666185 RepID=UPI0012B09E4F|nr:hypothetical protein [Spiribacter sp. 2438]QGM21464.1 hypothetical protein GJ672_03725 [Spiribacter sp. 2438]
MVQIDLNDRRLELDDRWLELAAQEARYQWEGDEGRLAKWLQSAPDISEQGLRKWLTKWKLARVNPLLYREVLARELQKAREELRNTGARDLPKAVGKLSTALKENGASPTRQTSLASKFVFSLFPGSIPPYDQFGRQGLGAFFEDDIEAHDYSQYFKLFMKFHEALCSNNRAEKVIAQRLPKNSSYLSQVLRMRFADKCLMLIGGFDPKRMER